MFGKGAAGTRTAGMCVYKLIQNKKEFEKSYFRISINVADCKQSKTVNVKT